MNRLLEVETMLQRIQDDALAQAGLRIVNFLRSSSQVNSIVSADIQRLGIFGNLTVHDFEQDAALRDERDREREDREET